MIQCFSYPDTITHTSAGLDICMMMGLAIRTSHVWLTVPGLIQERLPPVSLKCALIQVFITNLFPVQDWNFDIACIVSSYFAKEFHQHTKLLSGIDGLYSRSF